MNIFNFKVPTLLFIIIVSFISAKEYDKQTDFSNIFNDTLYGDISATGAPVLCADNGSGECDWNYDGYLFNITPKTLYEDSKSIFPLNSSKATLQLPPDINGSNIKWAGLYWQGHIFGLGGQKAFNNAIANYDHIKLKAPNGQLYNLTADERFYYGYSKHPVSGHRKKGYRFFYQCFKDITDIVKQSLGTSATQRTFTVGNINTTLSKDDYYIQDSQTGGYFVKWGNWGGWALVVVYEHSPQIVQNQHISLKNISLYQGFKFLIPNFGQEETLTIELPDNSFYTPKYGEVKSKTIFFAAGAERKIAAEKLEIYNKNDGWKNVSNGMNPPNNQINDTISYLGNPINPIKNFNPGIDLDTFDTSGILANEQTTTKIKLTMKAGSQAADQAFVGFIGISNDVYKPKICYIEDLYTLDDKKIGKDVQQVPFGSEIKALLTIRNDDNETAEDVRVIRIFDDNETNGSTPLTYVPNSTKVKNVGASDYVAMSDANDSDLVVLDQMKLYISLGRSATSNSGGTFYPNDLAEVEYHTYVSNEQNATYNYQTSYIFKIGNKSFSIHGPMPKCTEFNNTIVPYIPDSGEYNVVENNFSGSIDPSNANDPANDITTKIVNKDFNMSVLHLDSDKEHFKPITTYVQLEVVDSTDYNTTPAKSLPKHQFITIIHFNNDSRVPFTNKITKIHPNLTYRIKYVDWNTLFYEKNIICLNSSLEGNLKGIPACLDSALHFQKAFPGSTCRTQHGAPCLPSHHGVGNPPYDNQFGCFMCLMDENRGESILARDNFAVRPYAFRVFGNNLYKRSGEEFNITIKAVDEANATLTSGTENSVIGLPDFNVSVSTLDFNATFFKPSTTQINTMSAHLGVTNDIANVAYCPHTGTFTPHPGNFQDGKVIATVSYDETGVIELNVSEKPGQEFAIVDSGDTPDEDRYIQPATVIYDKNDISKRDLFVFIPYQFTTTTSISSSTNQNWLYMADVNSTNHNMSLSVEYTIRAQNKNGGVVQNFTKTCFPDIDNNAPRQNGLKLNTTFDLFLDLGMRPSTDANITFFTESNDSQSIETLTPSQIVHGNQATNIQQWIDPLHFENGIGKAKIHLNVARDKTKPKNPMQITLIDANTSTSWMSQPDATKIFNGNSINRTYSFYYGRLHIPDQIIQGNTGDIKAFYEIFINDNGQDYANIKGSSSPDDIHWYVNRLHSAAVGQITNNINTTIANQIKLTHLHSINSGMQKLSLHYLGNIFPYARNINISVSPWLLYNRYDPTATTISSRTVFTRSGEWLGRGKTFNDSEIDSSKKESNRVLW